MTKEKKRETNLSHRKFEGIYHPFIFKNDTVNKPSSNHLVHTLTGLTIQYHNRLKTQRQQKIDKMKYSIAACTLCAALAATSCQAWAPSAGFGPRTTTTSIDHRRRNQFQIRRTPTTIYATLEEDEQKERSKTEIPSSNTDSISEAFNRDEAFSPIPYSELTIGIVKETFKGENRVSQTPDSVRGLVKAGFTVIVQSGGKKK